MTDIVERLRARQGFFDRGVCVGEDTDIREAAAEIERLRADNRLDQAEIEQLRADNRWKIGEMNELLQSSYRDYGILKQDYDKLLELNADLRQLLKELR